METAMTAASVDAQGHVTADRIKTCAGASRAEKGATLRTTVHDCASWRARGAGQKTPGEHGSNLGVRNDAAPSSINSLVTGKGGDDGFTLILVPP